MRWFRRGLDRHQIQHDASRQDALLADVRHRFGPHVQTPFPDQATAVTHLLDGDDGLTAAAAILREFADAAHTDLTAQAAALHRQTGRRYVLDRRNYRPFWKAAAPQLRWPLFALPGALHPYIQVAGAVTATGKGARRAVRLTDPAPLLAHVFEILDLTLAGWEFADVRVDTDAAALAEGLITTAHDLRDAMSEAPPLPPPIRELMRRNNTITIQDPTTPHPAAINPGQKMREALLA